MKRIGILYDKESKNLFLLPNQVKALSSYGVSVSIIAGMGNKFNTPDSEYLTAGAVIHSKWSEVIANSDIIIKTNAFSKAEIKAIGNKTAITMASFLNNVDMLYEMLTNNVTGVQLLCQNKLGKYEIFEELEQLKAPFILKQLQNAFRTGLAKRKKDKVVYPANPKILILNISPLSIAFAKIATKAGFIVTLADDDFEQLQQLKDSIMNLEICDAGYETLVEQVKQNNALITTIPDPTSPAKNRITKQMAESMPKGSLIIDAGCEFGYSLQFVKKWPDAGLVWNKIGSSYYLTNENLTNLLPAEASVTISEASVDALVAFARDKIDNVSNIIVCKNGKIVDANVATKLKLYLTL